MSTQAPPGFLEPAYGGRTLADVLPAVGAALGAEIASRAGFPAVSLELPPAAAYVVMLVDGMGHDLPRAVWRPVAEMVLENAARASTGAPDTELADG